jgi:methionyl-tRNA formyltransferase
MREIRAAYFGRSNTDLSVAGLTQLLTYPELKIVSVTCGRDAEEKCVDGKLQRLAATHRIPVLTFQEVRQTYPQLDLVISFSNPVLFPRAFVESVAFGCVNLHTAPLPEYRGCHGIEHALINGDTTFAATLHFCDEGIDTGPVIEVRRFAIEEHDVATDIWHKIDDASLELLKTHMPCLLAAALRGRRIAGEPQDVTHARYYRDDSIGGSEIDPGWPYEKIVRYVRAMQHPKREPAYFVAGEKHVHLRYERGQLVVEAITETPVVVGEGTETSERP